MRLAISGQLLGSTQSLGEILDVFHSLGVDAVDLWPHNFVGGATPDERALYQNKDVEGARAILARAGVSVACLTLGGRLIGASVREGPAIGTRALIGAVDAAKALGAELVNCYLAGIAPALFVEMMKPAASYAGTRGVTIVLENEAHDDSGTARGMRAIVDAVDSRHFGALFDPCNFYQANDEPYPYAYEVLKEVVRYVHIKGGSHYDPRRRAADHRGGTLRNCPDNYIGYGALPDTAYNVDGLLRRLHADGYRGYVTLEPHVPAEHARAFYDVDVPYARSLLARLPD
jgi:sugar phosphate isomerase/epimerase